LNQEELMYFPNAIEDVCYQEDHIEKVLSAIGSTFRAYFSSYLETRAGAEKSKDDFKKLAETFGGSHIPKMKEANASKNLSEVFQTAVDAYEKDQDKYLDLMHPDTLAEYADDPPSFKTRGLKNDCPIIRKTLNNRIARQLDKYRRSFNLADPNELLAVVTNVSQFAHRYVDSFDEARHVSAESPSDFVLDELEEDKYWFTGVIGGGIRSHFLHKFDPQVFPNRSQDALWALWYLTEKSPFDCHEDSEFLMIRVNESIIAQNYFYPYDLFTFYALKIWQMLRAEYETRNVPYPATYRYVAVDSFLTYIARIHDGEIEELKARITDDHYAA
jgi:hypothetical protein